MATDCVAPPAIVCGVDDSEQAPNAIRVTGRLSDALGLRLVLVHVGRITPVPRTRLGAAVVEEAIDHLRAISIEAGEGLLDRQIGQAGISGGERRVVIGDPSVELLKEAEEQAAAAIVVGSRGRAALVAAVLSAARRPVVVVPNSADDGRESP